MRETLAGKWVMLDGSKWFVRSETIEDERVKIRMKQTPGGHREMHFPDLPVIPPWLTVIEDEFHFDPSTS